MGVRREHAAIAATAAFTFVAWAAIWQVDSFRAFETPIQYIWDSLFAAGATKSYADRGLGALVGAPNPWLGAPFEAQWIDFPIEDGFYFGVGMLSRVVGVVAALNITFALSTTLASVTMYLVARAQRIAPPLAMIAAVAYALAPFVHYRNISHVTLAVDWHLPLCVLVWLRTASTERRFVRGRHLGFACAVAVLSGLLNVYFLAYFVLILAMIATVHALRRRFRPALAAVAIASAGMGVYLLTSLDTFVYIARHGPNKQAVARNLQDTVTLALRPMELLVPASFHRIDTFASIGASYQAKAPLLGEFPSAYLGMIPIACVLAMVGTAVVGVLERRRTDLRYVGLSLAVVAIAIDGGLMELAQLATGFVAFRSNNRVSPLLLALGLLWAGRALTRRGARRRVFRGKPAWVAALAVAAFVAWEQSPSLARETERTMVPYPDGMNHWQMRERWKRSVVSDARLVDALEGSLPVGAGVFQLPAAVFPEGGRAEGLPDYEPFRLYIHSHRRLRFSYGMMKGRPDAPWHLETAHLPPPEMLARLRGSGFHAVVLANAAYAPARIAEMRAAAGDDVRVIVSEDGEYTALLF